MSINNGVIKNKYICIKGIYKGFLNFFRVLGIFYRVFFFGDIFCGCVIILKLGYWCVYSFVKRLWILFRVF